MFIILKIGKMQIVFRREGQDPPLQFMMFVGVLNDNLAVQQDARSAYLPLGGKVPRRGG